MADVCYWPAVSSVALSIGFPLFIFHGHLVYDYRDIPRRTLYVPQWNGVANACCRSSDKVPGVGLSRISPNEATITLPRVFLRPSHLGKLPPPSRRPRSHHDLEMRGRNVGYNGRRRS
ncbi:hypothetical protein JAAARDRAFT_66216 [Jaapia argillacea MUCL 33604]|uniref:Uncharacterized protein n=1 Tax=Jaapia argillacea MUCL 33604 TaxID=933084 RepID=A0A067Q6C8_9AGAM|nr:hypothetical protein JAAARDRAFT_66216 [Jaapia argillacea MUCL 33604]